MNLKFFACWCEEGGPKYVCVQEYNRLWCLKDCEVGECGGCCAIVWGELLSVWTGFAVLSVFKLRGL